MKVPLTVVKRPISPTLQLDQLKYDHLVHDHIESDKLQLESQPLAEKSTCYSSIAKGQTSLTQEALYEYDRENFEVL